MVPEARNPRLQLVWRRWLFLASAVAALGVLAPGWAWFTILALAVVCGALIPHLFETALFERWVSSGRLLIADTLLVGFALWGASARRPLPLAIYFVVILLATLTADRFKTLLGCISFLGILAALVLADRISLMPADAACLPLLAATALHFGYLGERARRGERESGSQGGELWALLEITDTITSRLGVGEVMHSIVDRVGDLVGTPNCSILLAESRTPGCFVAASKGHPEADMLELDLAKYPEIRHAMETHRPLIIDDVDTHPLMGPVQEHLRARGIRSLLVMPLLVGRELIGLLFLKSTRPRAFDPEVIRFCKVVSGVSANVLKNALLYRDVKETRDKLRRVLDASPDMIVTTDLDGNVAEFNPGAERLTGRSAADARGRPLTEVLGTAPGLEVRAEDQTPLELTLSPRGGSGIQVSLVSARVTEAGGMISGRVWIGRDVTKLRQVERSLAQAERLSTLGEVVAGVAHELNNPLSGVVGYAELLRSHASDPEQIRDLQRIVESALRCQKIVFNLLSFARKHAPEKRYQSLNDCVEKVLDLKSYHLRSSQIEIVLELDPLLPMTSFDFHQIDQVILNVLNNAEQSIRSVRRSGRIVVRTGTEADGIWLEIEDDGPGISEEIRDRVFDPFFTTKDYGQGTGLGLSVSYGILQEHGGGIELRPPRSGRGACFHIRLPIIEGPAQQPEMPSRAQSRASHSALAGRQILVAEDEPLVLELLARLLTEAGASVTMAQDGDQAWQLMLDNEFDLVVTDLCMPNVCGQELYERVAAERPELMRRFVFATGDLVRRETLAFLDGLPNRILTKPLEVETVRRVLAQAITTAQ